MKNLIYLLVLLFSFNSINAQKKAVTETGDEVLLYDNGTWKYVDDNLNEVTEVKLNPKEFKKPSKSNFLLKSTRVDVGVWLNPKEWNFEKAIDNPEAEYEISLKGEDLYGMLITEKMSIPISNLKDIAIENAKLAAPDIRLVKEEYRMVNGLKMLLLEMAGTLQGIKFTYYGYYFSYDGGTIQFITYTSQSLIDSYRPKAEELINGLVLLND
ncbi:hypothetical protein [Winogradskyella sp.]|uniref:hypothetical protein n=1 Tax=Winogradskyella sp. TaxID=1883156 RepID=UPI0025D8FBAA|nr:hypothetical protein [Winogradskyella sp.]